MDLSVTSLQDFRFIKNRGNSTIAKPGQSINDYEAELIDLSKINFGDDESWLYSCSKHVEDLQAWMRNDYLADEGLSCSDSTAESQKSFDSRTFTRPKKRFVRPSIAKYNEEVYGKTSSNTKDRTEALSKSYVIQEVGENTTLTDPLNFDLTQPSNSYYFENMVANLGDVDSFQNMSPPSLVNSMCSSTFANLMESSFIKNDPVLREIRDTDFTETVLLQDSEPPMFQSITESCSSLNSDSPESFLKKVSRSDTFRKNSSVDSEKTITLSNSSTSLTPERLDLHRISDVSQEPSPHEDRQDFKNFNGTYRRTPKSNNSPRILDRRDKSSNHTFSVPDEKMSDGEVKRPLSREDTIEDIKRQLSSASVKITDLNRLSYCIDDENVQFNNECNDLNKTLNIKHSSVSTGSADSLDRMSSISNSSRESNRMLNMADVDAIVEMQEKSLQQVMSTPKMPSSQSPWENNYISPIIPGGALSDSDHSSNDEYKSVRSSISKASLDNYHTKPVKSLGYLGGPMDTKIKSCAPRSAYQKPVKGSYSSLKSVSSSIPGSQPNLNRPNAAGSNLKSMAHKLKGSYTSLRPVNANLPVVPPISANLNTTKTLMKASNPNVTQIVESQAKVVEVHPMPRENNVVEDTTFVKPYPKASGLPRPTGIPRPASRIPGPRISSTRFSSRSATFRPDAKDNCQ